jgi:hypothetical protein
MEAHLDANHVVSAQTYSVALPFMALDNRPVAFSRVATLGRKGYRALSQREMFQALNAVLRAEPEVPGTTPIIDGLVARRRERQVDPGWSLAEDPLFARIKQSLATTHRLIDRDGKARCGIEDVYPALSGADLWEFEPRFSPRSLRG